ncbi:MAG: ketoacyl-ACP synthase III [Pseudomonadales bacterium]|nr:ketoacyl-ACP synthase III [Ardenticatenaceae bacterium]MCP5191329.1 ketoacyl-ACP synthase III [Pseudomonadales bacterium]
MKYAHIVGWGHYLPERILTNDGMASIVDTSNEWIYTRTGIKERRIANQQETTAMMAFEAAARALAVANVHPMQVDMIIVATSTPAHMFPSTASQVQDYLGASRASAFDLSAACTGFVYALSMAANTIQAGAAQNVVVIGAETMSRVLDWQDRGTCILFGDGAGAVVLKGLSIPGGILASTLGSDGSGGDLLSLPVAYHSPLPFAAIEPSLNGHNRGTLSMNGRQVFRFATRVIVDSVQEVVAKAGLTMADVALIVPHQANVRIIETAAKRLKVPEEVFYLNVDRAGNTSAASIPIALCEAVEAGRLKPDDNVIFVGFGGGLTWGASLVKWDVTPPEVYIAERNWRDPRYVWARVKSRMRRFGRRLEGWLSGSPTPEARLRKTDKR